MPVGSTSSRRNPSGFAKGIAVCPKRWSVLSKFDRLGRVPVHSELCRTNWNRERRRRHVAIAAATVVRSGHAKNVMMVPRCPCPSP